MAALVLSYFCLAFLATSRDQGPTTSATGHAGIFVFDTLFGGVKKRPSRADLERPPPLARSILLVLRAEVTPDNPTVPDIDRMLTAKGMQEAEGLGVYLQQHHIPAPDWIFVSPSERTAFTTELIRRHWGDSAPVAFEDILYILEFNDYFSFVAGLNDQFRRVMIVGHNPAILNTAKKLMKTHGIEDFPDCGLLEIRWDDLVHWRDVQPYSGLSKMAIDPNNNFFFSSPR
jgi:phosphohistidine phosphatase